MKDEQKRTWRHRFVNWCVVLSVFAILFHLAVNRYFAETPVPQWLWDVYDWRTWPLSHFRQWRINLTR